MKRAFPLLAALLASASTTLASAGAGPWANGAYYPGQYDGRYSANVYNNTQSPFPAGWMYTPAGNRARTDTFGVTPGTTTVSNYFVTNIDTTISVTNDGGVITGSNLVTTTNIISVSVTNSSPARTNVTDTGAAAVVSGVLGFGIKDGTPTTDIAATFTTTDASSAVVDAIGLDSSLNYFVIYVDGDVFAGQTVAGINNSTGSVNGSLWSGVGRPGYEIVENPAYNTNGDFIGFTTEIIQFPSATAGGYFNARILNNKTPFIFSGAGEISTVGTSQADRGNATYPFNVDGIKSSDVSTSGYTANSTSTTGGTAQ